MKIEMNGDTVIVDGVSYVKKTLLGKYSIIRTEKAGVHYGIIESLSGNEVILKNARRIWYWEGANTLNELSKHGLNIKNSKVSESVNSITVLGVIEIIQTTVEADLCIEACKWVK